MSPWVKKSMSREGRAPSRPFAPPLGRTISIAVITVSAADGIRAINVRRKRYPCHRGKSDGTESTTEHTERPKAVTEHTERVGACRVPKFSVFSVPRDAPQKTKFLEENTKFTKSL